MKNTLFKNFFSLSTVQLVNYIFPLITVPYVSRIIGPDSYGIINYAIAFNAYFTLLIGYGFDLTGTRKIAQNPDNEQVVNQVFSEVMCARILLFVVSCLLFGVSLNFVTPLKKNIYVAVILFISTISSVLTPQYVYQGKQQLSIFALLNFIKRLLNTILIFIIIKEKSDYVFLPTLNALIEIAGSIFLFVYAIRIFRLKFHWVKISKTLQLLNDEKTIFLSMVVISIYSTTNTVVLGFFSPEAEVGFYTISMSLITIIYQVISNPISTAVFPFIGNSFVENHENGLEMIRKIFPMILYLTLFACIFLFIFAPLIIHVLYGSQYTNAILSFRIMAFIPLIVSMSNVFGVQTMLNLKMDKLFFKATAVASVIGFFLNLLMSKFYGYIGTAWNTLIIELFVTCYMFYLLKKNNVEVFDKKYFKLSYSYHLAKGLFVRK